VEQAEVGARKKQLVAQQLPTARIRRVKQKAVTPIIPVRQTTPSISVCMLLLVKIPKHGE
jgi:hypothetical protein